MRSRLKYRLQFATLKFLANRARTPEGRTAWAQLAGRHAWQRQPEGFRDLALERILTASSPPDPRGSPGSVATPPGPVAAVVHVLTTAPNIGGHVNLLLRWIERDDSRVHSVVLTEQHGDVPAGLRAAAEGSGGAVTVLDRDSVLPARALALRELLRSADLVVLHQHPHDVVPTLALAGMEARPPVVYLNHADHCFWLGASVADQVWNLRESGAWVARHRRGIGLPFASLPIPLPSLPPAEPSETRPLTLVTMASPYKYVGPSPRLPDLVEPVLAARPEARLVALGPGPEPDEAWSGLCRRFPGRVELLGRREDARTWLTASAVFLDAYPFASLTGVLEAAQLGLPTVSYAPVRSPGAEVLVSNSPGLGDAHVVARTPAEFRDTVLRLLDDPLERHDLGTANAEAVEREHGAGWVERLAAAYAGLAQPPSTEPAGTGRPSQLDELLRAQHETAEWVKPLPDLALELHAVAPARGGLRLWIRAIQLWRRVRPRRSHP